MTLTLLTLTVVVALLTALENVGWGLTVTCVPIALLIYAIPKTRRKYGLPALITLGISAVFNTVLKWIFAIPRPESYRLIAETGYGFPSGHAMNSTAFVGIYFAILLLYSRNTPINHSSS